MAWTNTQKQIAMRACKAAGITEEQRTDMILRNFSRAHHRGDITSTSPKLTNHDFEHFMAIVEQFARGTVLHYSKGYWQHAASDWLARMRGKAQRMATELEGHGLLAADGAGLAGWIGKRVAKGETDKIADLDYHGLLALILGLEAYARQKGVLLSPATVKE